MTGPIRLTVRFRDDSYHAAVDADERADQLLLRSLYHFGIDPADKGDWRLAYAAEDRPARGLYLDHAIGEQVANGGELRLEEDVAGNRRPSTGRY